MGITKLSVCLPTCNGDRFVAEAIGSVLSQTFDDFELIVVDDCSDDTTREIVGTFTDPRMTIYENDRRLGIPGNWNRCLDLAKGEYICIFHQDDLMLAENLERKVAVLTADPTIGMVHSAVELRVEESAPEFSSAWMEKSPVDFISDGLSYFRKLLLRGNCVCAPTVVARRESLARLGGFNERFHFACDYELWMRVCLEARLAYLSTPLVAYRWHTANATHSFRLERGLAEAQTAAQSALQFYREKVADAEEADLLADALDALREARAWAFELERGRAWLGDQVQSLRSEIESLRTANAWLEEQRHRWQHGTEERETHLKDLESRLPFRVLVRLGMLPRRSTQDPKIE